MAELEVAKHGKNIIQVAAKKEHSAAHKLREVALEIVTIFFAVSLSIWLHGASEHYHEQQQVRSFLLGLKADLQNDVAGLKNINALHHSFDKNLQYLAALDPNGRPDGAKFDAAYLYADANVFFKPANSRYEGFRLSGKLTNIEDEKLLNDIISLYQYDYDAIHISEGGWSDQQQKLRAYLDDVLDGDSTAQHYKAVTTPRGKRLLNGLVASSQLYERLGTYAAHANRIIKAIDAAYPGAKLD